MLPFFMLEIIEGWSRHSEDELSNHYSSVYTFLSLSLLIFCILSCVLGIFLPLEYYLELDLPYNVLSYECISDMHLIH